VNMGEKVGNIGVLQFLKNPRVAVSANSIAAASGLKSFDEIEAVNGKVVDSYDQLQQMLSSAQPPIQLKVKRDKSELNIVLTAGKPNVFTIDDKIERYAVLPTELENAAFKDVVARTRRNLEDFSTQNAKLYGISFSDCVITKVADHTAASRVKLQAQDRIVSVNGKGVDSWVSIMHLFQENPDDMKVIGVVSQGKGRIVAVRLAPSKEKGSSFAPEPKKVLGVEMSFQGSFKMGPTKDRWVGISAAAGRAFEGTWVLAKTIVKSLALLVTGQVPASQMGGPISIFNVAGEAASLGIRPYIMMMNLISVNLGLLNLLPIPVLDGGHLMMFAIEAVTRRPLTLKARQIATTIGLVLVLALMALAIFNDVMRLVA